MDAQPGATGMCGRRATPDCVIHSLFPQSDGGGSLFLLEPCVMTPWSVHSFLLYYMCVRAIYLLSVGITPTPCPAP